MHRDKVGSTCRHGRAATGRKGLAGWRTPKGEEQGSSARWLGMEWHSREEEWLLQTAQAPFRLCRCQATTLQHRQHSLQAWFLCRPFLPPSRSGPVAATSAKQTHTAEPLWVWNQFCDWSLAGFACLRKKWIGSFLFKSCAWWQFGDSPGFHLHPIVTTARPVCTHSAVLHHMQSLIVGT